MLLNREKSYTNIYIFYIVLCIIIYILGSMFIPLMEVDSVQYANISREMLQNKSFLQIFDQGSDYLDKPPMLFWSSAISMYLFGINDFAFMDVSSQSKQSVFKLLINKYFSSSPFFKISL